MPHQTTVLIDRTRRTLKSAASRAGRSLDFAVEKNSGPRYIPSGGNLRKVAAKARVKSGLNEGGAMSLPVEEVRQLREGR